MSRAVNVGSAAGPSAAKDVAAARVACRQAHLELATLEQCLTRLAAAQEVAEQRISELTSHVAALLEWAGADSLGDRDAWLYEQVIAAATRAVGRSPQPKSA